VRLQLCVSNKSENTEQNATLKILFEKIYVLKTAKYEVKIVRFANGRVLISILVRSKRSPTHITSFQKLPPPIRYQLIKDLVNQKMAYILDQL